MHISCYIIQEFEPVHVKIAPRQNWEIEKLGYSADVKPVLPTDGPRTDGIHELQQQKEDN